MFKLKIGDWWLDMRLDKYLCKALNMTRSEVQTLVKKGLISVNNEVVKKKDFYINEDVDEVFYQNQKLDYHEFVYLMLNKPQGYVSAVRDDKDPTVIDLIEERKDVFPVGRLDKDTEGLLILTNNGTLAHFLTSPKHEIVKKYYVKLARVITDETIDSFNKGLYITDGKGETFLTKPALLEKIDANTCYVSITEGKFHQIKKMFLACQNEVIYLKRIAMGKIVLDDNLPVGKYRRLTNEEIILLKVNSQLKL